MGLLLLLTALLACCSGGYAVSTIFHNSYATFFVAFLWGAMILTLDRFLVASTRKLAIPTDFYEAGNSQPPYFSKTPWVALGVRLPIAILIGLVVSKPIEARLLQPWINEYERSRHEEQRRAVENDPVVVRLNHEIDGMTSRLGTMDLDVQERRSAASDEADGTGGSKKKGMKGIWNKKDEYYKTSQDERDELKETLGKARTQLSTEHGQLLDAVERDSQARATDRSIISDLAIMQELGSAPDAKGRTVWVVSGFLTLLFVLIECIPVLSKTLSPFDAYDAALQVIEHEAILDSLVQARRKHAEASVSDGLEPPIQVASQRGQMPKAG